MTATFTDDSYYVSIARAPSGELYLHNGDADDVPKRWSVEGDVTSSGVEAPAEALEATDSGGAGDITGTYRCRYRYTTADGAVSNFSPVFTIELAEASGLTYSSIAESSNERVTGYQVWRTTAGQEYTYYLDCEDDDSSSKTDDDLRASEALRYLTADGYPNANRFTPPPAHMSIVVSFQDRMWFTGSTDAAHRGEIMFSEAGEPESVPECNSLTIQEDGDDIVGLMPVGSFLYVLKRRHIYRLSSGGDPRQDASAAMVAERGCLNNRCWCRMEGMAALLDENGVYLFDGSNVVPIDAPVRNYFLEEVNWDAEDTFSVARPADEEMVKVFVATGNDTEPEDALCYHYRDQRWHLENYPSGIGATGAAVIDGMSRLLANLGSSLVVMDVGDQEDDGGAIAYTVRFGEFVLLPIEKSNPRRVTVYYTTTSYATMTAKLYYNGSSTAATVDAAMDNEMGVTVTAGSSSHVVDLRRTAGFASFRFDRGMDPDADVNRTVMLELTGRAWGDLKVHRIEIDGVRQ